MLVNYGTNTCIYTVLYVSVTYTECEKCIFNVKHVLSLPPSLLVKFWYGHLDLYMDLYILFSGVHQTTRTARTHCNKIPVQTCPIIYHYKHHLNWARGNLQNYVSVAGFNSFCTWSIHVSFVVRNVWQLWTKQEWNACVAVRQGTYPWLWICDTIKFYAFVSGWSLQSHDCAHGWGGSTNAGMNWEPLGWNNWFTRLISIII